MNILHLHFTTYCTASQVAGCGGTLLKCLIPQKCCYHIRTFLYFSEVSTSCSNVLSACIARPAHSNSNTLIHVNTICKINTKTTNNYNVINVMEDVLYIQKCLFTSHNQFDKIIHEFDCQIATFQILHKVVVKCKMNNSTVEILWIQF